MICSSPCFSGSSIKCIQRTFGGYSNTLNSNVYSVAYHQFGFASRYSTATLPDSPINKMKTRFNSMDKNKDGIADENDIIEQASDIAKYGNVSPKEEKEICEQLKRSLGYGVIGVNPKGVTADEYVEGMRKCS